MTKNRIFPMHMRDSDVGTGNWLEDPKDVTEYLLQTLHNEHSGWKCTSIRLDPSIHKYSYKGKPFLTAPISLLPSSELDTLVLALVEVPDAEPEELFVTSSETGFPAER